MSYYIESTATGICSAIGYYVGGTYGAAAGAQIGLAAGIEANGRFNNLELSNSKRSIQNALLTTGLLTATTNISYESIIKIVMLAGALNLWKEKLISSMVKSAFQSAVPNMTMENVVSSIAYESTISNKLEFLANTSLYVSYVAVPIASVISVATSIFGRETIINTTNQMLDNTTESLATTSKNITATSNKYVAKSIGYINQNLTPEIPLVGPILGKIGEVCITEENLNMSSNVCIDGLCTNANQVLKGSINFCVDHTPFT